VLAASRVDFRPPRLSLDKRPEWPPRRQGRLMAEFTLREIGEMESINTGIVKLAGAELGVRSFGIQVFDFPAGFSEYPEHDHGSDGQEEVYVVLSGSAEFAIDGERVPLDRNRMLRIGPGARRKLTPGPDGVRILAIGSAPGQPYERPHGLRMASQREER
jgi:mannose-6-phosphate isomerase-like protein (cupin superfamily)